MRIAYLTTDDVNPALVRRWAAANSVRVTTPRPTGTADRGDAVVLDFDHLPNEVRRAWVAAVRNGSERRPVLVHGYNLPAAERITLRRGGAVVVDGRLRRGRFARWLRSVATGAGKAPVLATSA